jgi:hypothetical protein
MRYEKGKSFLKIQKKGIGKDIEAGAISLILSFTLK